MKDLKPIEHYEVVRLILASQNKHVFVCPHGVVNTYINAMFKKLNIQEYQCLNQRGNLRFPPDGVSSTGGASSTGGVSSIGEDGSSLTVSTSNGLGAGVTAFSAAANAPVIVAANAVAPARGSPPV